MKYLDKILISLLKKRFHKMPGRIQGDIIDFIEEETAIDDGILGLI